MDQNEPLSEQRLRAERMCVECKFSKYLTNVVYSLLACIWSCATQLPNFYRRISFKGDLDRVLTSELYILYVGVRNDTFCVSDDRLILSSLANRNTHTMYMPKHGTLHTVARCRFCPFNSVLITGSVSIACETQSSYDIRCYLTYIMSELL